MKEDALEAFYSDSDENSQLLFIIRQMYRHVDIYP